MTTECSLTQLEFHALGSREVVGRFDGGRLTSDGGGLLLREVDQRIGLLHRLAGCFDDYRNPNSVEHSVQSLVAQRVYGLALGYEDLNNHDALRAHAATRGCAAIRQFVSRTSATISDIQGLASSRTAASISASRWPSAMRSRLAWN